MDNHTEGKSLIFTDIHFGLKGNSISRLNIAVKAVKCILDAVKKHDIKNIFFGGDLLHQRVSINVNTMNVVLKCVEAMAKHCKVWLIVGNHDTHYKNSVDVSSLNMFKHTNNVEVVNKVKAVTLNGQEVLLAPWLADFSAFTAEQFDMAIGHFDIPSKFLLATYIQEHSSQTASDVVASLIDNDSEFNTSPSLDNMTNADVKAAIKLKDNTSDLIKSFVDLVKRDGWIFAGHIHAHKEFVTKGRNFTFVGTPYQQTLGDMNHDCGFYILDEHNNPEFVKTEGLPVHVEIKMSEAVKDIGGYDFSKVRGNIVKKVYDCDVDRISDAKVSQKIQDFKPYEELIPSYDASIAYGNDVKIENESIALIKKSKLEYIRNYISNIDQKVLDDEGLDRETLFKTLKTYYDMVSDEK